MAGYDQKSNVVLSDSKERVYSMDEGVEEIPLGLYLVKGDMMYAPSTVFLLSFIYICCSCPRFSDFQRHQLNPCRCIALPCRRVPTVI